MHEHITVHVFARSVPAQIHISKHDSFGNTSARVNQLPIKALRRGTTALIVNNKANGAALPAGPLLLLPLSPLEEAHRLHCLTLPNLISGIGRIFHIRF